MNDRYREARQKLLDAILCTPGTSSPELRQQVQSQSIQLSGYTSDKQAQIPSDLVPYTTKVACHAFKVTDKDIEALKDAGYSEDAIFEITLSAALGAGMARLNSGLAALKGENNAPQKN
jgi:alkylhydroperoxidase family enzyme